MPGYSDLLSRRLRGLCLALAVVASGCSVAPPPAQAQGTTPVTVSEGLTLQTPRGWRATPADAKRIVMVGPDGDTTIIATLDQASDAVIRAQLTAPVDLGGGIVLTPTGQPRAVGDYVSNDYAVRGTRIPGKAVVMIRRQDAGRAMALIGISPAATVEAMRATQARMMQTAVVKPAAAPTGGALAAYLKGRYLVRFYSGSGYHEKQEMWLCSDGSYAMSADGGGATAGVASGAFRGGHNGRWSASGALGGGRLTLTAQDGRELSFSVADGSDGLYLDGKRWMRGDNSRCR